jgi:hypothetical protein
VEFADDLVVDLARRRDDLAGVRRQGFMPF